MVIFTQRGLAFCAEEDTKRRRREEKREKGGGVTLQHFSSLVTRCTGEVAEISEVDISNLKGSY